jgi:hypothetical protein
MMALAAGLVTCAWITSFSSHWVDPPEQQTMDARFFIVGYAFLGVVLFGLALVMLVPGAPVMLSSTGTRVLVLIATLSLTLLSACVFGQVIGVTHPAANLVLMAFSCAEDVIDHHLDYRHQRTTRIVLFASMQACYIAHVAYGIASIRLIANYWITLPCIIFFVQFFVPSFSALLQRRKQDEQDVVTLCCRVVVALMLVWWLGFA